MADTTCKNCGKPIRETDIRIGPGLAWIHLPVGKSRHEYYGCNSAAPSHSPTYAEPLEEVAQ
jgi:hypothetical protein